MKYVARAWAVLAIASMLFYAFTGAASWAELNTEHGPDSVRFLILLVFHTGWAPMLAFQAQGSGK